VSEIVRINISLEIWVLATNKQRSSTQTFFIFTPFYAFWANTVRVSIPFILSLLNSLCLPVSFRVKLWKICEKCATTTTITATKWTSNFGHSHRTLRSGLGFGPVSDLVSGSDSVLVSVSVSKSKPLGGTKDLLCVCACVYAGKRVFLHKTATRECCVTF